MPTPFIDYSTPPIDEITNCTECVILKRVCVRVYVGV